MHHWRHIPKRIRRTRRIVQPQSVGGEIRTRIRNSVSATHHSDCVSEMPVLAPFPKLYRAWAFYITQTSLHGCRPATADSGANPENGGG